MALSEGTSGSCWDVVACVTGYQRAHRLIKYQEAPLETLLILAVTTVTANPVSMGLLDQARFHGGVDWTWTCIHVFQTKNIPRQSIHLCSQPSKTVAMPNHTERHSNSC